MTFLLICVAVAVIASRSRWVQQLDDRVLGPSCVATALWIWTAMLAAATAGSVLRQVWVPAILFGVMSLWVGYGAYKRSLPRH